MSSSTRQVKPVNPATDEKAAQIAREVQRQFEAQAKAQTALTAEVVENVQLQIPGGPLVEMGAPKGGTMRKVAMLMAEMDSTSMISMAWIKALLYVRSLDGVPVQPLNNVVDLQHLADKLGDRGEEIVMSAHMEYWPPFSPEQLPLLKK